MVILDTVEKRKMSTPSFGSNSHSSAGHPVAYCCTISDIRLLEMQWYLLGSTADLLGRDLCVICPLNGIKGHSTRVNTDDAFIVVTVDLICSNFVQSPCYLHKF
jgi:hypothetical protein